MFVSIKDQGDSILLKWVLSKTNIPKSEIISYYEDETYAGDSSITNRIGQPSA